MARRATDPAGRPARPPAVARKRMSAAALARLLNEDGPASEAIDASRIRAHIRSGAPADRRGRMRLQDYAAWLAGRAAGRR